jgi:hypothetical protein
VREAQERERLRLAEAPLLSSLGGEPAELDQARLLGGQLQAELRKSVAKLGEEPLGVIPVLEADDVVVGEAHDAHIRDLALVGVAPRPNRSGDFAVDDDDSGDHGLVGSYPGPAALECVPVHVIGCREGSHVRGHRIRPLLEQHRQILVPQLPQRAPHHANPRRSGGW